MNRIFSQIFNGIIFHFGAQIGRGKNLTQDAFYWGNFLMAVFIKYLYNHLKLLMANFFFEKIWLRAIEKNCEVIIFYAFIKILLIEFIF